MLARLQICKYKIFIILFAMVYHNEREDKTLAHFDIMFGFHGNQVTKTTDFDIPCFRTQGVYFDISCVF